MLDSRRAIEDRTGEPCPLFAYPYGDATEAARALVTRHFTAGFGTRLAHATAREEVSCLSRVDAFYLRRPRDLARFFSGRWPGWLRARLAARLVRRTISVARFAASG